MQLVERDKRHVRLTAVGEDVVARGRELLAAATDLAEAARSATRPLSGPLRLGAIPTIAPFLLPSVLPALRRAYGELKLYLREDLTKRLLERLRAGGLDVALIALPFDTGDLYVRELFKDEFAFVAREGDPAVREKSVALRRIDTGDMLLLEEGHCLRDHAIAACGPRRGRWESRVEATSLTTLIQMVEGGLGVTLLPADHAGRGHSQRHPARRAPLLAAGALAHAGAGGAAHLPAPPRRGPPRGLPHRAPPPLGTRQRPRTTASRAKGVRRVG